MVLVHNVSEIEQILDCVPGVAQDIETDLQQDNAFAVIWGE